MRTPIYVAMALSAALALGGPALVKAEDVYGGASSDRGYYSGRFQTDEDVGMTDATRSDNLDQGRLYDRGMVRGYVPAGSPSIDRTYSDYRTERRGTDEDVGMTDATRSDNLDQGRLDNRGLIGGRIEGSPSIDRGRYNEYDRDYREARTGNLHEIRDMLGQEVVDANGDQVGTIENFVADDFGRIDFAVVNHEDKNLAVPFEALSYDTMGRYSLNMTEDQLASAPVFDRTYLADRTWPDHVYRYYGISPRW